VAVFCARCGAALGSIEGERKQVTVLFVDVKGSTDLSGSMSAEEWWEIMEQFFAVLTAGVDRFDGRTDRFTGDGIMAVFGAPSALEDHAVRACHAALSLRRKLDEYGDGLRRQRNVQFAVRMGLSSGDVVAGTIGQRGGEYTSIGLTPALAQRMESLAAPGSIYLTEATVKLVRGFFDIEPRGRMNVKGVAGPMPVFELVAATPLHTPFDVARTGELTRFVGRGSQLAVLESAFQAATANQAARIMCIAGEPGVGKSRLCHEFIMRCRADGAPIWQGSALAHTGRVPFATVLALLRDGFAIAGEAEDVARSRVSEKMTSLGAPAEETALLLEFLGIQDPGRARVLGDPQARQRHLVGAAARVLDAHGRGSPVVVLLEDLHWIDAASASFLADLLSATATSRMLVLATHRIGAALDWLPASAGHLQLHTLGDDASGALLAALLGAGPGLDELRALVHERAGGNPFFAEEIVRSLIETGVLSGRRGELVLTRSVDEIEIPQTVESVLAARIDRLDADGKRALQFAAVIGHRFSVAILARVANVARDELTAALAALREAELIVAQAGTDEYVFKHALAEQVAYETQLGSRRARIHAVVAHAIATDQPERLDELAGLISTHWERARRSEEAARWCARAAAWAGFNDPNEALRQWRSVRRLAAEIDEPALRDELALTSRMMLLNLAWRQGVPRGMAQDEFEREMTALYEEGSALAQAADNQLALTVTVASYGAARGLAGHLEDMARLGMDGFRVAERAGMRELQLSVLPCAVYALHALGRYDEVLRLLEESRGLLSEDPSAGGGLTLLCPYAWILSWRAAAQAHVGALTEAFAGFDRALTIAREYGDFETESWTHMSIVQASQLAGRRDGALEHAERAREIAERTGGAFSLGLAQRYLSIAHILNEQWAEAIAAAGRALEIWRSHRVGMEAEPHALTMLGRAQLGAGDPSAAADAAAVAVALADARGTRGHELEARLVLARALMQLHGRAAAAEAARHLSRAGELAAATRAASLRPRIHVERAELARLNGDARERDHELDQAQRLFGAAGAAGLAQAAAAAAAVRA
jgi:class 3 adenylate cyclase/tetratricopeptide (TPR) repeat protein